MVGQKPHFEAVRRLSEALDRADADGVPPDAGDRPVLGYTCSLLPDEVPWAMGLLPSRIRPLAQPPTRSPSVVQTFCCTWVQALVDQAMAGRFAPLWGVTLPCNSCDSVQNLPDIWRMQQLQPARINAVRLPVLPEGEPAVGLMRAELDRWVAWLAHHTGAGLDRDKLRQSIALFNRLRKLLRTVQAAVDEGEVAYADLLVAALSAQVLHREKVADELEAWLAELDRHGPDPGVDPDGPAVMLVGGPVDRPNLAHWLAQRGALVVADDLCTSELTFDRDVDVDPAAGLDGLARRHVQRPLCPVRLDSAATRTRRLLDRLDRSGAEGVVLLPHKGCEPHAFDNVLLKKTLTERSIPHIELEIDPHFGGWGPLTNRLEAFLEMIELEGD